MEVNIISSAQPTKGDIVGDLLGSLVGALDGDEEGRIVPNIVGLADGLEVSAIEIMLIDGRPVDILSVGVEVGDGVGPPVEAAEGNALGMSKGAGVPDPPVQKPQ